MRKLSEIESDIVIARNQLSDAERLKASYDSYANKGLKNGIKFCIYAIVSVVCMVLWFQYSSADTKEFSSVDMLCAVSIILFLFTFIVSIKFCYSNVKFSSSIFFLVVGTVFFVVLGYCGYIIGTNLNPDFLTNLKKDIPLSKVAESFLYPETLPPYLITKEMKLYTGAFLLSFFFLMLPTFIFFLASVTKFFKRLYQKNTVKKALENSHKKLNDVKEEKKSALSECEENYKKAVQDNDVNLMKWLEHLDYDDAKVWLDNYQEEQDRIEGEKIYEEQISKDTPECDEMIKAAKLGNVKACVWVADVYFYDIVDMKNNSKITEEEWEEKAEDIKEVVKNAKGKSKSASVADIVIPLTTYGNKTKSDYKRALKDLRNLQNDGSLHERAKNLCDIMITNVVNKINEFDESGESDSHMNNNGNSSYDGQLLGNQSWTLSKIRSDFSTYKSVLSNTNRNIGVSIINNRLNEAVSTIQQLIDSFDVLKEQQYCDVDDVLAAYYWLNGMVIACGIEDEIMRKKVADANFELAYDIADSGLRNNISKIREVVAQSYSAKNCNSMLEFFDNEDNYLSLIYQQEKRIENLFL